ncbi:MAG: carboxypeptidase-like regulatory domain-containing protein [Maribacter sp.]|nr:carboxypeptidase-like regulatory domain-containing protein [Maribacter sp.]
MRSKSAINLCFFLCGVSLGAQSLFTSELQGKVQSKDGDVAGTHVLNTTSRRATITDEKGYFSIPAHLYDTIVFSAVQYKRKEIVVTASILNSKFITVPLQDALTELEEVVVTPYNLTGSLMRDTKRIEIDPVVTASTLGLPNAYVMVPTKVERELYAATANPFMSFDPLINAITGYTKMLKEQLARDNLYARTQRVRDMYADSLFRIHFKISEAEIDDFMYFCEVDPNFQSIVDTHDRLKIWDYMQARSIIYRENNALEEKEQENH